MYLTLPSQNSLFNGATHVKPCWAGLGTGRVTRHEYPVMKAPTLFFLCFFLYIDELNCSGHGATYHCCRDLQVTRKGTSQSDCCNIVLQKGTCFDWQFVQSNLQVQITNWFCSTLQRLAKVSLTFISKRIMRVKKDFLDQWFFRMNIKINKCM